MNKLGIIALLAALVCVTDAGAQEEALSIEEIRARLKENAAQTAGAPAERSEPTSDGFVVVDDDLEQAERALEASEAELVRQLGDLKTQQAPAAAAVPFVEQPRAPAAEKEVIRNENDVHRQTVATLKSTNSQLTKKLNAAEQRARKLDAELGEARSRLLLAETEVDRLSRILEERNRASIRSATGRAPARASAPPAPEPRASSSSKEPPIATVAVAKANLRAGPGLEHSPLMSVTRGTRLLVETRSGTWYRVVTPNGTRAWISTDIVVFASATREGSTIKVRGYDASIEEEADRLARGRTG